MKPAPFVFHAPADLASCHELLAEHGDEAAILAGGQGLVTLMRLRLARPAHVVSIRRIGGVLAEIQAGHDSLTVGASVTLAAAARSERAASAFPGLRETIRHVATPAVRTRATMCGNVALADPSSEIPALAVALGARVRLTSSAGVRRVAVEEFLRGPYMTARRDDELITALEFPATVADTRVIVREVGRVHGGFAIAGVVVTCRWVAGRPLPEYGVACFGVGPTAIRVRGAERVLAESGPSDEAIAAAADEVDAAINPHSDFYASAAYRRSLARTLLSRALLDSRREVQ